MIDTANLKAMGKTKPFLFADFSELLLVAKEYEELSRSSLYSLLNGDAQEDTSTVVDDASEDVMDESNEDISTLSNSEDERASTYVNNCFSQFNYRKTALKEFYPFEVSNDILGLKQNYSLPQLVYFFLLCCSQLGRFNAKDGVRQHCAATFTKLSAEVMKLMLSPSAQVYIFDANSEDRKKVFGTDKRKALVKLIDEFLFETPLTEHIKEDDSASGDYGIDLVGIFPFPDDKASGRLTVFGQCAAEKEGWEGKTLEASPVHLRPYIHFNHDPATLMFIPLLYRNVNGRWFSHRSLGGCVIVDRIRILHCLDGQTLPNHLEDEICQRLSELGFSHITH